MENNNSVTKLTNDVSFRNWAEGRANPAETEFWDRWITLHPENRHSAMEAQQRILGFVRKKETGSQAAESWQRFETKISEKAAGSVHRSAAPVKNPVGTSLVKGNARRGWLMRVAAIVIVLFSGGLLWSLLMEGTNPETGLMSHEEMVYQTIETKYGEQKELQLIDGTQIILNANSVLRYGRSINRPNRIDIELEGEAYFTVTSRGHDRIETEEELFQVITKDGVVRVLGTRFSVSSHNDKTVVVLEEGSVSVVTGEGVSDAESESWVLYPNELAEFSRNSTGLRRSMDVDTRLYTSWKDSRLFFENMTVREVISRLERTFGVPFKINDSSLLDRTVSGSVENSELEVMAQIFAEILNVTVEVSDEQVLVTTN